MTARVRRDLGQRVRRRAARSAPCRATATTSASETGRCPPTTVAAADGGAMRGVRGSCHPFQRAPTAAARPHRRSCLVSRRSETAGAVPNAAAAGQALAVLQPPRPAPRAGAGRRDRPRPRAAPLERLPPARGAAPTRASSTHLPEERRYGLGVAAFELGSAYTRQEPLQRIARPVLARLVDATDAQRPPRGAARARRALRRRGARARPAAAGHRRRRAAARPPDRQRPGDARRPAAGAGAGAVPRPAPPSCSATASGPASLPALRQELTGVRARRLRPRGRLGDTRLRVGGRRGARPLRPPGRRRRGHLPGARGGRGRPRPLADAGERCGRRALPADPRPGRAAASATCPEAVRAGAASPA